MKSIFKMAEEGDSRRTRQGKREREGGITREGGRHKYTMVAPMADNGRAWMHVDTRYIHGRESRTIHTREQKATRQVSRRANHK